MKITRIAKEERKDVVLTALRNYMSEVDDNWNYITPEELEEDAGQYFLLDIRSKDVFEEGHIKGSSNIFWQKLLEDENLNKLPKDKVIVLICYVGHTASQMLLALRLLGYEAVALKFGMGVSPVRGVPVAGWLDYGFDVVKGQK